MRAAATSGDGGRAHPWSTAKALRSVAPQLADNGSTLPLPAMSLPPTVMPPAGGTSRRGNEVVVMATCAPPKEALVAQLGGAAAATSADAAKAPGVHPVPTASTLPYSLPSSTATGWSHFQDSSPLIMTWLARSVQLGVAEVYSPVRAPVGAGHGSPVGGEVEESHSATVAGSGSLPEVREDPCKSSPGHGLTESALAPGRAGGAGAASGGVSVLQSTARFFSDHDGDDGACRGSGAKVDTAGEDGLQGQKGPEQSPPPQQQQQRQLGLLGIAATAACMTATAATSDGQVRLSSSAGVWARSVAPVEAPVVGGQELQAARPALMATPQHQPTPPPRPPRPVPPVPGSKPSFLQLGACATQPIQVPQDMGCSQR